METEIIDKLFLELSQVSKAQTWREIELERRVHALKKAAKPFVDLMRSTDGRIPTERLSLENWHNLVKANSAK
jgi:hypothetical protein